MDTTALCLEEENKYKLVFEVMHCLYTPISLSSSCATHNNENSTVFVSASTQKTFEKLALLYDHIKRTKNTNKRAFPALLLLESDFSSSSVGFLHLFCVAMSLGGIIASQFSLFLGIGSTGLLECFVP